MGSKAQEALFPTVLVPFYNAGMEQRLTPDPALYDHAKAALAESAGWARVGLTFGNERLREQALETLATNVADRLSDPPPAINPNQLRLFDAAPWARMSNSSGSATS